MLMAAQALPAAGAEHAQPQILRSDRLNRTYEDLASDIAAVSLGALTVKLTLTSHRLEIIEHRLELSPRSDGTHDASVIAQIRGEAHLLARIEIGGLPGELEDQITVPLQEARLAGRLQIERVAAGYVVTPLELPECLELAIESRLGGQLVALCESFSFLALGGVACEGLDRALSTLRLPLPPPGEARLIEKDELTEREQRQIEAYLSNL